MILDQSNGIINRRQIGRAFSKIVTVVCVRQYMAQQQRTNESNDLGNDPTTAITSSKGTTVNVDSSSTMSKVTVSVALLGKNTTENLLFARQSQSQEGATMMDGNIGSTAVSSRHLLGMASAIRAVGEDARVRHPLTNLKSSKAKVEILPLTSAAEDVPKVSFKKKTQHSATAPQRGAEQQSAHPHKIKNY